MEMKSALELVLLIQLVTATMLGMLWLTLKDLERVLLDLFELELGKEKDLSWVKSMVRASVRELALEKKKGRE